jgi:hypothetical protein
MANAAIITADIVNYTVLKPTTEKKMVSQLSTILKDTKFEFYRGDSFQAYIKHPMTAFRLLLQLRMAAKSHSSIHDIRTSIGIGKVDIPVRSLRTATGEAFVLSGRAFDQLADERLLLIQSGNEQANIAFRIIAYYTDHLLKRLTSKQAEVIAELLKEQTQAEVAKKLKKAQATINKHAQAAGWVEIQRLLNEYKEVITQFDLV